MSDENAIDRLGHRKLKILNLEADIYALLANFSTLMNFTLGLVIALSLILNNPLNRILVMRFIMLGASFDAIDGRLARRSHTKPRLGEQFDTLADLSTFGFAPSMLILYSFYPIDQYFALLLAGMYLFAAGFRLSRFMLSPTHGFFHGMPSPVAATYIAAWYMLPDLDPTLFVINVALISTVMVVNLPYTAMKKATTLFQKLNFIFTVSLMLLLTYSPNRWMEPLATIWIYFIFYFIVFGPYNARLTFKQQ